MAHNPALLSSYQKDEPLVRLARLLKAHGWDLLGSAGTNAYLKENGIECRDVAEFVGAPILGHRVVTLSRELYAGLLAGTEDHTELERLGIPRIDLVYVILYPLEEVAAKNPSPANVIEMTDIGGPTLLRAAAKGQRIALSDPHQIDLLEEWFQSGAPEKELQKLIPRFSAQAERRVADYVSASAAYWQNQLRTS